jgi:CubicO group peptidase (beta-lactamase class C family)
MILRQFMAALALVFLVSRTSHAQEISERIAQAYQARASQGYLVGASIGVMDAKTSPLSLNFGEATDSHALFSIGSISKSFAGVLLAKLSLEKKIDLNAPIEVILPELKGSFTGTVTPLMLATHSARLLDDVEGDDTFTDTEMLRYLKSYVPGENRPEGERNYSNLGFLTLSLIIRATTHENYVDLVQREIFKPLQMNESGFQNSEEVFSKILKPHDSLQQITHYDLLLDLAAATGGIYSSLADMMKYLDANLHPEKFPSLTAAIRLSHEKGLGWDSEPGATVIQKNGAMSGFGSLMRFNPQTGFGAVAMCNSRCTISATDLVDVAFGKPDSFKADPAVDAKTLKKISGRYSEPSEGLLATVTRSEKGVLGLTLSLSSGELIISYRLIRYDETRFRLDDGIGIADYIRFVQNENTRQRELHYFTFLGFDSNEKPLYREDAIFTAESI